jgi:hypothetical protein
MHDLVRPASTDQPKWSFRVRFKSSLRIAGVVVVVGALCAGAYVFAAWDDAIDDGYALLGATEMLVGYMESHDGRWPRGWSDLRPEFEKTNGRVSGWSYEQFQSRIDIDFGADPAALRSASLASPDVTFEVVHAHGLFAATMGSPQSTPWGLFSQVRRPVNVRFSGLWRFGRRGFEDYQGAGSHCIAAIERSLGCIGCIGGCCLR